MRLASFLAGFLLTFRLAEGAIHDVRYGTFEAPDDFVFEQTGTADSFRGKLTRKSDHFTINFDVGPMAGALLSPGPRGHRACYFFRMHTINGLRAATGLERKGESQTVATTIYDPFRRLEQAQEILSSPAGNQPPKPPALEATYQKFPPANFSADFQNDADLAEFMIIVSSYRAKSAD